MTPAALQWGWGWSSKFFLASSQEVKIDKNLEPGLRVTVRLNQNQLPGILERPQPSQPMGSEPLLSTSLSPHPIFTACLLPPQKVRPTGGKSCRRRTLGPKLVSTGATQSAWPPASVSTEPPPMNICLLHCLGDLREPCLTQNSDWDTNPANMLCVLGQVPFPLWASSALPGMLLRTPEAKHL